MDSPTEFITAHEQCPQKPRGRKKGNKDTDKPPAAAVGFDTVGMTAEQVREKLEGGHRGRSRVRKGQSESSTGPGHTEKVDRPKKRKAEREEIGEVEKESKAPKTRKTRPKKRKATGQEVDELAKESGASKAAAKKAKTESKTKKTKNTKAGTKDPEEVKVKKPPRSKKTSPEEPKAVSTTQGKSAESKARYSRKSSAYHQAKNAALRDGKTDAEAKAAGKAVA